MVYRFRIVSDDIANFKREIEIDPEASFFTFRNAILDCVNYSKDEINSFFICNEDWKREDEIVIEDFGSSSDTDVWVMDTTPICELIEEEGEKLEFVFDFLTDRSFYIELKEIVTGKSLKEPVCVFKEGKAPAQHVDLDEFEKKLDAKNAETLSTDMDIDFYGDSEFNDDELGDGFDDMNMMV